MRNLAYMVSRREKHSRSFLKLREQIFERQLALLADEEPQNQMSLAEMSAVLEANHGPTVYDKMFSHPDSEQHTYEDFELIISRIAGEIKEGSSQILKDNPPSLMRKKSMDMKQEVINYKRNFSDTSQSDSDDSFIRQRLKPSTSSSQGGGSTAAASGGRQSASKKSHHKDIKKKSSPLDKKSGGAAATAATKYKKSKAAAKLGSGDQSDSSLDSSEVDREFSRLSPRKDRHTKAHPKISMDIYSDTDSEIEAKLAKSTTKTQSPSKTKSSNSSSSRQVTLS